MNQTIVTSLYIMISQIKIPKKLKTCHCLLKQISRISIHHELANLTPLKSMTTFITYKHQRGLSPNPTLKVTLLQFLLPLFSSFLIVLISICFYRLKKKIAASNANRCTAPPAGGAWPIIGHLHIFGAHQLTNKTLAAMADK